MSLVRGGIALALMATLLPITAAQAATTPQTGIASPRPEVGVLSKTSTMTNHHCTASIVNSPKFNVILTAAHCVADERRVFFAPGFHDSGTPPYGVWQSAAIVVDPGWKANHDPKLDFAFVVLQPNDGRNVGEVTGSWLNLKFNAALPANVTVYGYPNNSLPKYTDNKLYSCDSTASLERTYWEILQCLGIPDGFSGGPWVVRGTKDVIGAIGGIDRGGPSDTDPRNYSVYFDGRVKALYDKAVAAVIPPPSGNLGYPLGDGPLWQHAQLITNGAFTGSTQMDMIVRWSDGEVTLYQGGSTYDPQKPFVGESRLAAPNGTWTRAKGIATINKGVVVTWSDGEVTYYGSVDRTGFHNEVQLAAPNALWRDHASYIAGLGSDLVVVWNDGETTLYRGVPFNGLGSEHQLIAPNDTWKHAQTISGGDWTGTSAPDLLVRWSDGEFTIYGDVSNLDLTAEHQVEPPNALWVHATVTAGRGGDIIVRWSDGEVSLYPGVDVVGLHREIQLVAP